MPLDKTLLDVCRLCADVTVSGALPNGMTAVVAGELGINAAVVGQIPEGTVVCFRGTLSPDDSTRTEGQRVLDWLGDFHAELVPWGFIAGKVHLGFSTAVDSLTHDVESLCGDGPRIFCGHSKGGSMAALAAYQYWRKFKRPCQCVTFGAARIGDDAFAAEFEKSGVLYTRYEAAGDVVPHVPLDSPVADFLAGVFGCELPVAAYKSCGNAVFVNGEQTLLGMTEIAYELMSLRSLMVTFAKGGFAGIRDAHSIGEGGAYWTAVNK